MLLPSVRFDLPFTCVDSSGVATAPTGTPTGTLFKNGSALGTTVTVTMSGAQGIASCTIPNDAAAGDRFFIEVSAVISGVTYVVRGPAESIESPQTLTSAYDASKTAAQAGNAMTLTSAYDAAKTAAQAGNAMTLTSGERTTLAGVIEAEFLNDLTGGTFLAGVQAQIQAILDSNTDVPVVTIAAAVADAVRTELATELARLDVAVSTRLAAVDYTEPTDPPTVEQIATRLLVSPANKLATDSSGRVTPTTSGSGPVVSLVIPLRAISEQRFADSTITLFINEQIETSLAIVTSTGSKVDQTGVTASLYVEDADGLEVTTIADLDPVADTVGGTPYRYPYTVPEDLTSSIGTYRFALRDNADQRVIAQGDLFVRSAAGPF